MAKKTAAKKVPKEPREDGYFPSPRRVSKRDFEIYVLCKSEGKRQKDVAAKFLISQPRVSKIVNRVEHYLSCKCPDDFFELPREKRLIALFRTHKMRLEHAYEESMAAWERSKESQHRCKFKPVKGTKEHELVDRIVTNRDGDQRHLQNAVKWADRLMEFEGFDSRGNVDTTTAGRVFEAPDVTEPEAYRMIKRDVYKGRYDTPGDIGPPEWFLQQVGAKKPGNGYKPYVPEVIFPTKFVRKDPYSVITPSTGVINNGYGGLNNDAGVINNENITPEKPLESSQSVTQQQVAKSASAENVLYANTSPVVAGSGPFSGEQTLPRPKEAGPKIVPTPLSAPSVGAQPQAASPSPAQSRSPEPGGSGNATRPADPHELPVCTREEAKRRGLIMWRELPKSLLPSMTASDWH